MSCNSHLDRDLVVRKAEEKWGSGIVEQVSLDLQNELVLLELGTGFAFGGRQKEIIVAGKTRKIDIFFGGVYDSAINLYSTYKTGDYYGIYIRGSIGKNRRSDERE